jgi:YaiO family outer membrane protein
MRMLHYVLACAFCAVWLARPACANGPDAEHPPANAIEAGGSYDALNQGFSYWQSQYLFAEHRFAPHQVLYGQIEHTRRFDLDDGQLSLGYYHPLSREWLLLLEGTASPTHEVLPQWSGLVNIGRNLPYAFRAELGYRHSDYRPNAADLGTFTLERYFSQYRAAYTLYLGKPEGAGSASAHRFAFSYYYTDFSSVTLAYTTGREVENVGPPTGIISTDVRDVSLYGRHWLSRDWALTYGVHWHEQGHLYTRQGVRIGVRRAF